MEKLTYISEQGYVRVQVDENHPAAFEGQGWAYEHVVVAIEKIGRLLKDNECVHHINGIKTDNRPENLRVMDKRAHLSLHNRGENSNLKEIDEENYIIECACGCGEKLWKYDKYNRPRDRVYKHWDNLWDRPVTDKIKALLKDGAKKAKEINDIMGREMYTHLRYMMSRGIIERVGHGIYKLKTQ